MPLMSAVNNKLHIHLPILLVLTSVKPSQKLYSVNRHTSLLSATDVPQTSTKEVGKILQKIRLF